MTVFVQLLKFLNGTCTLRFSLHGEIEKIRCGNEGEKSDYFPLVLDIVLKSVLGSAVERCADQSGRGERVSTELVLGRDQ